MKMMKLLLALLAGLVFGLGLILSGMTDPAKVIGFLDLAGNWDPSLGLVMGGAVLVGLVTFRFSARRTKAFLGDAMHIPTTRQIDRRLVLGGITFGVGWGLAGYCPGPALASLASGGFQALLFIAAMLAGMGLFALLEKR
jgi:uncharacterized membrane protein YedE/YeeE